MSVSFSGLVNNRWKEINAWAIIRDDLVYTDSCVDGNSERICQLIRILIVALHTSVPCLDESYATQLS